MSQVLVVPSFAISVDIYGYPLAPNINSMFLFHLRILWRFHPFVNPQGSPLVHPYILHTASFTIRCRLNWREAPGPMSPPCRMACFCSRCWGIGSDGASAQPWGPRKVRVETEQRCQHTYGYTLCKTQLFGSYPYHATHSYGLWRSTGWRWHENLRKAHFSKFFPARVTRSAVIGTAFQHNLPRSLCIYIIIYTYTVYPTELITQYLACPIIILLIIDIILLLHITYSIQVSKTHTHPHPHHHHHHHHLWDRITPHANFFQKQKTTKKMGG